MPKRIPAILIRITIAVLFLFPLSLFAPPSRAQEKDKNSAGIVFNGEASAKDVGLPIYPGSRRHKDNPNDSPSANMGLWGAGSGFKLTVMKMESDDSPEKVAAFYKKALAKYGKVLDCTNPPPAPPDADKNDSDNTLTCGDDKPDKGDLVFKSGTKQMQHIAAIQPNGKGSLYQLVAVGSWNNDSPKK
jgi:hypothetical protein